MPRAYRQRIRCVGYAEPTAPKRKPTKKRSEMTEDEKEEADLKRLVRRELKAAKDDWEKSLSAPWAGPAHFSWPADTLAMYKSDAKSAFGLTDKDLLTLPYEAIQNSPKTFYSFKDIRRLAKAKFAAGALPPDSFMVAGEPKGGYIRLFKKKDHTPNRRVRTNWYDHGSQSWAVVKIVHLKGEA